MNYISPMANNVAWHGAVEKLLDIELTPRCQYIRVIISELARISDHLLSVGAMGLDTGAFTFFLYAFYQRERIYDIFESLCGAALPTATRASEVSRTTSHRWLSEKIREFLREFPRPLTTWSGCLIATVSSSTAPKTLECSPSTRRSIAAAAGPVARASGVPRDLRKDEPYLAYADFDFQVCCAKAGDCFARYYVRIAEMRESMKIVQQAIENLPPGRVDVGVDQRTSLPTKQQVYQTIEGTITHFELVMANRGFTVPHDESYAATEAPNGELGFYVVGDGSDVAWRARCRPPSFIHFAIFPHLIEGHTLSDIVAVLGSLNIIAAELDR